MKFKTVFVNKSSSWKRIQGLEGYSYNHMKLSRLVSDLAPKGEGSSEFTLISEDPKALYSRYEKVEFFDDKIVATQRSNWNKIDPYKGLPRVVEFELDEKSKGSVSLYVEPQSDAFLIPPGIKRRVQVSLLSPYVRYRKVVIRVEDSSRVTPGGTHLRVPALVEEKTLRSKTELSEIDKALANIRKNRVVELDAFGEPIV